MSRLNLLKTIVCISIAAVIIFPAYVITVLEPSFVHFITQETEAEAIQTASHMSSTFFSNNKPVTEANLPSDLQYQIASLQAEFNIIKVKIFNAKGKIIYSTSREDIGTINTKSYFQKIVSNGNVFTKIVQKSKKSLEDQVMMVDVVETYVPIMHNQTFAGAFEIYYDITASKNKLSALLLRGKQTSTALALVLLAALLFTAIQAYRSISREQLAAQRLKQSNDELEQRVQERTSELNKMNASLEQEIVVRKEIEEEKEELIGELTESIKQVKTLRGLLPICSSCQQIRDEKGKWNRIDSYIQEHTEAELTHGICPDCAQRLYPDLYSGLAKDQR